MTEQLFEKALGVEAPWEVESVTFDPPAKTLTISISFASGTRFPSPEAEGLHPVHDTVTKRYRHLNFFQHECILEVRSPRVRLPNGSVRLVEPPFAGRLSGFTLLFEALIMAVCREMTFAAAARLIGISEYQAKEICHSYVDGALAMADHSDVKNLAMDETSKAKGHDYVFIAADADTRRVLHVGEGKDAAAVAVFAEDFAAHQGDPEQINAVSIDMSPAFIKGVGEHFPDAMITFDKFHVIAHASKAIDETRRKEQRTTGGLKGMRWTLLKDRNSLSDDEKSELDALIADVNISRTARAWTYREMLREILQRKQPNVVRTALLNWITCVNRSKVDAMKKVAKMVGSHLEGIVAWARTRITNGFLEALNGVFQAAKRKARGFRSLRTIRTVIFMLAGKLDFSRLNPHIQRAPT